MGESEPEPDRKRSGQPQIWIAAVSAVASVSGVVLNFVHYWVTG